MKRIQHYFPEFSALQVHLFEQAAALYTDWNQKINVISRKDIDNIELHHFLHSLAIYKAKRFESGARCIDLGTGGGFPGIPLAIALPDCSFVLVDSIGKKLTVAQAVVDDLGLKNVEIVNSRIESLHGSAEYITGRAVEALPEFHSRAKHLLIKKGKPEHGLYYLKGPDVSPAAFSGFRRQPNSTPVSRWFSEAYFEEKWVWHVPLQNDFLA